MNIGEVLIQLENLLPGVHISYEVTHMGGCVEKWEHQWAVKEKFGYLVRKLQNKLRVSPAQIAYEMFFTKEYVVIKLQKLNEAEPKEIGIQMILTETLTNNLTDDVVRIIAKQVKDAFLGFQPHE